MNFVVCLDLASIRLRRYKCHFPSKLEELKRSENIRLYCIRMSHILEDIFAITKREMGMSNKIPFLRGFIRCLISLTPQTLTLEFV